MIRCAIAGPTPGSLTRVSRSAVLTSTGACDSALRAAAWVLDLGWAGAAGAGGERRASITAPDRVIAAARTIAPSLRDRAVRVWVFDMGSPPGVNVGCRVGDRGTRVRGLGVREP